MARRKKNESLVDVLLVLPWWVSAVLALISYSGLRWVMPYVVNGNPVFSALTIAAKTLAWMPGVLFGFIAVLVFFKEHAVKEKTPKVDLGFRPSRRQDPSFSELPPLQTREPIIDAATEILQESSAHRYDSWSLDALRSLEWKRFELLCAKYYEIVGFKSETVRCGADGGIDVKLFKVDPSQPLAIVQCKAWNTQPVGVKEIRELLGVMAHEKVSRGIFITTSIFTQDANEFGKANPIQLLDGEKFVKKLLDLSQEQQFTLLRFAFAGDYNTPTCASCGIKMVKRNGKRGAFWGCSNYPKCKSTFAIPANRLAA